MSNELKQALQDLEAAAWRRSWTRLKLARLEVERLTGIKLEGKLKASGV